MLSLETSLAETIRLIFDLITFIVLVTKELIKVSGQLPPVRVGVWVKVRVSFRVGGNQTIAPDENCHPRLGLAFGLGLVFGLGAIFFRGNCPRTVRRGKINFQVKFCMHYFVMAVWA